MKNKYCKKIPLIQINMGYCVIDKRFKDDRFHDETPAPHNTHVLVRGKRFPLAFGELKISLMKGEIVHWELSNKQEIDLKGRRRYWLERLCRILSKWFNKKRLWRV